MWPSPGSLPSLSLGVSISQGHLANEAACWGMAAIWVLGELPGMWGMGILGLGRGPAWNQGASWSWATSLGAGEVAAGNGRVPEFVDLASE